MGDAPTLLAVHTDLEQAVTLASQARVKEALDLCSSVMEVVCTHIETLGLVDPDEPGSPHSPTTEKAAALLLGGFDRIGMNSPATTLQPTANTDSTIETGHGAIQSHNSSASTHATDNGDSRVRTPASSVWTLSGNDLMPLTVAHRIDFWQQINSTWLLAIRCAGNSTEMDLVRQEAVAFTGRRGSRGRTAKGTKTAQAASNSTTHATGSAAATDTAGHTGLNACPDDDGDLTTAMSIKDWVVLRDNITSCGDVLELYGLVDYSMGFAELEIVEAIHAQMSRM
ncbi:hypothetical protein BASA50_001147 [Batrachochytrium salamandrivorans]|uniref:Uncharacterized protein n=1 Tax=Batrachochytrium salamandrivorans TaxID=1357716 RepID=A0ABQ8ERR8_9FUNG|nr:hypothetical protein BASA60_008815 [Batrachochytrium salamandrivorans]KAH6578049.1 hypothetical protein BASA62_000488 [Batrachochytrium salamandrivorans]KAH6585538.1 hypothetical protein BASA50_001147 [Batrachochytrium salamandrivorans]KAH9248379.1 hypothetical protein BASA81_013965 [Batrachochytrium salamandrivorans]KAH9271393.1 hypothetical protein BASA83_006485 [Batrachochytrium salamandrivorans]